MLLIESFVDRHYGLAVIFITPLTIFIAEYGSTMPVPPVAGDVIHTRMIDTALGCVIGLSGGLAIHSTRLRVPLRRLENWLLLRFSE
ncbi:FUSC family protein [Psychrobacter sp. 1Y4]